MAEVKKKKKEASSNGHYWQSLRLKIITLSVIY